MRGRVARGLVHLEAPEVGVHLHAGHEVAVGHHDLGDAVALAAALGPVALERVQRHAALAGHLEAPLEGALGVRRGPGHVAVVGVHPQLAPGRLDDRAGQPVVVRVRVGADEQAHVLQPQPGLVEGELELAHARPARTGRCPPAPRRSRPRSRTRSRAARPARAAGAAAARARAARGRRARARAAASCRSCRRTDGHGWGIISVSHARPSAAPPRPPGRARPPRRGAVAPAPARAQVGGRPRRYRVQPGARGRGRAHGARTGSTSTPGIEDPRRVERGLGGAQRRGERLRALTVVPGPVVAARRRGGG